MSNTNILENQYKYIGKPIQTKLPQNIDIPI